MNNEQIEILKDSIYQKKAKTKQLFNLQQKEAEQIQKEKEFCELAEKAQLDYNATKLLHLTGSTSEQEWMKSKNDLDDLSAQLDEIRENIKFAIQAKTQLNSEISQHEGNVQVYRGILRSGLAEEFYKKMASDKKLNEKLALGYAAFIKSGTYDVSWYRFLFLCFAFPEPEVMQIAETKLKAEHELLRD